MANPANLHHDPRIGLLNPELHLDGIIARIASIAPFGGRCIPLFRFSSFFLRSFCVNSGIDGVDEEDRHA